MGYCKHDWTRRSDVLRAVFTSTTAASPNDFYVCQRCLKIEEVHEHDENEQPNAA